jgi:hypothetical protein
MTDEYRSKAKGGRVLLAVEQLVGRVPLVVSGGFMPPSILAVILGCLGLAEQLGRVGRLAIGPGGLLVCSGGALVLAPALGALVVAPLVVGHSREPSSVYARRNPRSRCGLRLMGAAGFEPATSRV